MMSPTILLTLCLVSIVSAATNSTSDDSKLTCDDGNGTVSEQVDTCELQTRIGTLEVTKIDAEEAVTKEDFDDLKVTMSNETLPALVEGLMEEIASLKKELEKQISDAKTELETNISNNTEALKRSAICGYRSLKITNNGVTIKNFDSVDEVVNDVGSKLGQEDGKYTAGVDGVYEMTVSGYAVTDKNQRVKINLKGSALGDATLDLTRQHFNVWGGSGGRVQGTVTASRLVAMRSGEDIYVVFGKEGNSYLENVKFCVKLYKAGL